MAKQYPNGQMKTAMDFSNKYKLGSPFDLDNETAYHAWLDYKLDDYPQELEDLIVEVDDPKNLSKPELAVITALCSKTNMAIYTSNSSKNADKHLPLELGKQLGLTELDDNMGADDGITALRVVEDEWRSDYIPYTNKGIHWHTDGYYNTRDQQINALLLHCVSPASSGGENALLDHEIAYIRMRQADPALVYAMMQDDAMTIPANISKTGEVIRPDRTGPVFSILPDGNLHMRYTARAHSIIWKQDIATQRARLLLHDYLHTDSPYIYRGTLQSGMGLISNNVLHDRSAFEDDDTNKRLLYRLRYYQRIANT